MEMVSLMVWNVHPYHQRIIVRGGPIIVAISSVYWCEWHRVLDVQYDRVFTLINIPLQFDQYTALLMTLMAFEHQLMPLINKEASHYQLIQYMAIKWSKVSIIFMLFITPVHMLLLFTTCPGCTQQTATWKAVSPSDMIHTFWKYWWLLHCSSQSSLK